MSIRKFTLSLSGLFFVLFFFSSSYAQVTTSSMNGTVKDTKGETLPAATIVAVHVPSGSVYGAAARDDGRFNIPGLRVGGPYKVTASFIGYGKKTVDDVYLELGQSFTINFELADESMQVGEVVIAGARGEIISSERTGTSTNIKSENLQTLPTISRRLEDFTRLTPQYGRNSSFAGFDNRLNNIMVDGAYFNNSFGLAGQPGDRTGVSPISLDAIDQIQVNVSPFDVRQGNFVGAGVNTVTKSGTNEFSGSVYYNFRNDSYVGTKAKETEFKSGTFDFNQFGFRLGGPILKDKLFFFANYEGDKITQPGTTYLANTGGQPVGGNTTRVLASDLDALSAYLSKNFNYQTGPYQGYDFETPSDKFLFKLDFNLDQSNKISLRYSHLDSYTDVLLSNSSSLGFGSRRSNTTGLNFKNSNYKILENIRSLVGEWNSILSSNITNNFIAGYTFNDESREDDGSLFPLVDVLEGGSVYTTFGAEPFTPNNELRYKSYQVQNNTTLYLGDHNITAGLSLERYESENIFFPGKQSVYVYNSLADFYKDADGYLVNPNRDTSNVKLRRFQVRWSNIPGQSKPVQPLKVWYSSLYAQDQWKAMDNLNVIGGFRVDIPSFEATGFRNSEVETMKFRDKDGNSITYKTDKLPNTTILFSPRIGVNWDVFGDKTTQVRGGTGVFTGKPAYVWISNQIGNNGILTGFQQFDNTYQRPFNPNPDKYKPSTVSGTPASSYELALADEDFKFPQTWRTNIGVDQRLPVLGLIASAEFIYGKDINGFTYINANLPANSTNFSGADNRPRWTSGNRLNSKVTNAIVLQNQSEGYNWSITAALEKPFSDNWYFKTAYNYGEAYNLLDPGSIAAGAWFGNPHSGDPNNPKLSYSAYSPGHRLFVTGSYKLDYFNFGATTITVFFEGITQGNYSYRFSGDLNGDGGTSNDLIYIPKDQTEMNFEEYTATVNGVPITFTVDQQKQAFESFINQDDYLSKNRGKYAERNAARMPMVWRADLSLVQDVYADFLGNRNSLQFRLDILNFMNLLNSDWGVGDVVTTTTPLISKGADSSGKVLYRLRNIGDKLLSETYSPSAGLSDVYRLQLGLRYSFN